MIDVEQKRRRQRNLWPLILTTFAIAYVFSMIPFPPWARHYRPDLISVALVFWCVYQPARVGVVTGWLLGLFLDVMHGNILGQNALAKTVIAYLASRFSLRIQMFPVLQQTIVVGVLLALDQFIIASIRGVMGGFPMDWRYYMASVTGLLFWPWLYLMLGAVRRNIQLR